MSLASESDDEFFGDQLIRIHKAVITPSKNPDYRLHVSFESAPARNSPFLTEMHEAPYSQRLDYHKAVHGGLLPDNKDAISPEFGLSPAHTIIGPGAYEENGELTNNPSTQMVLNSRLNGTGDGIHAEDKPKIIGLTSLLGYLTHQNSVGYHKQFSTEDKPERANAHGVRLFRPIEHGEMEDLYHYLAGTMEAHGVPALVAAHDGFRALNFGDMPHGEFVKRLYDAMHRSFPEAQRAETWDFGTDGDLIGNNWKASPKGEDYLSRASSAGFAGTFRRLADIYDPVLRKIDEKFAGQYGWGQPRPSRKGVDIAGTNAGTGLGPGGTQLRQDDRRIQIVGPGYQGSGANVSGSATGERQNDPTRLTHFDTFPKVRYRELSGTTYINKPAMDILWPLFGARSNNRMAVTVAPDRSRQTVDTLHGMADMRGVAASDHFNLHHVADELSTSLAYNPASGLVIVPLSNPKTMIGLVRHEDVHAGQNQLLKDNYTYLTHPQIRDLRDMDGWKDAEGKLRNFGYNSPQMLKEIPAYIAQGAHRKILGLNDEQARLITERYVQHIIDNHGKDAAKRIFRHSNSIAKLAARGVIGKGIIRISKAAYQHEPVSEAMADELRNSITNSKGSYTSDRPFLSSWMLPDGRIVGNPAFEHEQQAGLAYRHVGIDPSQFDYKAASFLHHANVVRLSGRTFDYREPFLGAEIPTGATRQQLAEVHRHARDVESRGGNFSYEFVPPGNTFATSSGNDTHALLRDPEASSIRGDVNKGLRIWIRKSYFEHDNNPPADLGQKLRDAVIQRHGLTDNPVGSNWLLPDGRVTGSMDDPRGAGAGTPGHENQAIQAYKDIGHPLPEDPYQSFLHHAQAVRLFAYGNRLSVPSLSAELPTNANKRQVQHVQALARDVESRNGHFSYQFVPPGQSNADTYGMSSRDLLYDANAARIRGDVKKGMIRISKGPSIHPIDTDSYSRVVRPNLPQDAPYTLAEFNAIQPDITHYAMNADGGYGGHGNESMLARTVGLPDPADPMNQGPSLDKNYPAGKMDLARVRLQNDPDRPEYGEAILGALHSKFNGGVAMKAALADPVLKSLRDQTGDPLIKTVPSKLTKPSDIAAVVKRGLDGKFWYKEWKDHIDGVFPPSDDRSYIISGQSISSKQMNRTAHILFGIGGADTSVEDSLRVWAGLMSRYKSGLMGSEAQIRNLYDSTINNTSSKILKAGINGEPSAVDIFNATQGIMPSSPKVNEYTAASMGDYNSGPFDEWMSRVLCGVNDSPTNGEYPRALKLARRAYIDYQKNPENPHLDNFAQFQASLWTGYKRVVVAHMLDTAEKITKHSNDPKHLKIAGDIINAARKMSGEGRPHELFVKYGLKNSDGSFNDLPESPLHDIIAKHEGTLTDLKQSGAVVSDYVQKFPIDSGVQKVRDALKSSPLADTVHMERIKGVNYVVGVRGQVRAALEHAIDQSTVYMPSKTSAGPSAGHDIKFGIGKGGGWESRVTDTDALKSHFANTPEFLRDMQRAHVLLAGMAQAGKNDTNAKYYGVKPENSDPFAAKLADVSPWVENIAKLADEERENAGQKRETIDAIRKALYESSRNKKIKITKSAEPYIRIQALRKDGQAGALQGRGWQGEICIISSDTAITGRSGLIRITKAFTPKITTAPFYSNLRNVIAKKMQGVAPAEQISNMVRGAGISSDEIEAHKLNDVLTPGMKISKQPLLEHIDANTPDLKYTKLGGAPAEGNPAPMWHSTYNGQKLYSPGLSNYKETLMRWSPPERAGRLYGEAAPEFNSSHWQRYPNVLLHTRTGQSKDIEGNPVTHLDELQSDWHQIGRKKGYETAETRQQRSRLLAEQESISREWDNHVRQLRNSGLSDLDEDDNRRRQIANIQALNDLPKAGISVPDAPFKENWHELGFKQALREAVENGSTRLTWSPGGVQNKRYALSKHLDEIGYKPTDVTPSYSTFGQNHYRIIGRRGGYQLYNKVHAENDLADVLGVDIADKIKNGISTGTRFGEKVIQGKDLDVGGGGMRRFYDTRLPSYASKLVGQYGGTSGMTQRIMGKSKGKNEIEDSKLVGDPENVFGTKYTSYNPYSSFVNNKRHDGGAYTIVGDGWHVRTNQDESVDWNKYSRSWHRSHGPHIEVSNRRVEIKRKNPETGEIEDRTVPVDDWRGKKIEEAIHSSGIIDNDPTIKTQTEPVHYMDISPKLRDTIINEGLPMWGHFNAVKKSVRIVGHDDDEWPSIPLLSDPSTWMTPDRDLSKAIIRVLPDDSLSKTVQYNRETGSWVTNTPSQMAPDATWLGRQRIRIANSKLPESSHMATDQMRRIGINPVLSTQDDNGVVHHTVYSNLNNLQSLRRDILGTQSSIYTPSASNIHRLASDPGSIIPKLQPESEYEGATNQGFIRPDQIQTPDGPRWTEDELASARRSPYLQGRYTMTFVGHDGAVHVIHSMDPGDRAANPHQLADDSGAALGRPPIVMPTEKPAETSPGLAPQSIPDIDRTDRVWRSDNIMAHPDQLEGGPEGWRVVEAGLSRQAAIKHIQKEENQEGPSKFARIVVAGNKGDKKNTPLHAIYVPKRDNDEAVLGPRPANAPVKLKDPNEFDPDRLSPQDRADYDLALTSNEFGSTAAKRRAIANIVFKQKMRPINPPAIDEPQPQPAPMAVPGAVPRENDEDPSDSPIAPLISPTAPTVAGDFTDWNNNPPPVGSAQNPANTVGGAPPNPNDAGPSMHPSFPASNTDVWRRALASKRVPIGTDPLDPERYDADGHAMNAPDYIGSEYLKQAMAHPQIRGLQDAHGNPLIVPVPSGLNNVRDLVNLIDDGLILRDSGDYDAKNWGQEVSKAYDAMVDPAQDEATNRKIKILAGLGGNGLNFKDNIRGLTKMWSQWKSGLMRTPKQISQIYDSDPSQASSRLTVGLGYRGDPTPGDKHLATLGIAPEHYRHNAQVAKFLGDHLAVPVEDWMTRLVTGKDIVPTQTEHEKIDGILRSAFDQWNRTPKNRNTPLEHGQLADALWQGYNRLVGDHMEEMAKRIQYAHPDRVMPYFDDNGVLKAPPAKGDDIQSILNGLMRNQRTKLAKGIKAEPQALMRELGLADETGAIRPPKLSPIHEFDRKWEPLLHAIHGTTGSGAPIVVNHGIATHHINKGADELDKMIREAVVKDPELAGYMHVEPDGQGGKQFRGDSRMLRQLLRSNIRAGEAAFAKVDNDAVPETTKIHLSPGTDFESLPEIDRERLSEVFDKNPEFAQDAYTMHQTMKALAMAGRPDSELAKQYLEEGEKADRSEPLATQLADASKAMRLVFRHAYENKRGIDKPIVLKKGIGYGASIRISSITRGGNSQVSKNWQAGRIPERERPDYGSVGHEAGDGQGRQTGRIRIIKGLPDPEEEALAKKAHLRECKQGAEKCCHNCSMYHDLNNGTYHGHCTALKQDVGHYDICDWYEHKKTEKAAHSDGKMLPPPVPNRDEYPFVGQIIVHGVHILLENKKGDVREGIDTNGHKWRNEMGAHYGEIANTVAMDGDAVDVYVLDNPDKATHVYIVHQNHAHGPKQGHDEDKLIVGACSEKEAKDFYNKQYDHPGFFGGIDAITIERFQEMFRDGKKFGRITKSLRVKFPVSV